MSDMVFLSLEVASGAIVSDNGIWTAEEPGAIEVIAVDHQINAQYDPTSGFPNGRRTPQPIVITKEIDSTSPLLLEALITNEPITAWQLRYRTADRLLYYSVDLVGAYIAGIKTELTNQQFQENWDIVLREKVIFAYSSATCTYDPDYSSPPTATYDWGL